MSIISAHELRALRQSAGDFDKEANEREYDERLALARALRRQEQERRKEAARARRARFF